MVLIIMKGDHDYEIMVCSKHLDIELVGKPTSVAVDMVCETGGLNELSAMAYWFGLVIKGLRKDSCAE